LSGKKQEKGTAKPEKHGNLGEPGKCGPRWRFHTTRCGVWIVVLGTKKRKGEGGRGERLEGRKGVGDLRKVAGVDGEGTEFEARDRK